MVGSPWRLLGSLLRPQWRSVAVFGLVLSIATAIQRMLASSIKGIAADLPDLQQQLQGFGVVRKLSQGKGWLPVGFQKCLEIVIGLAWIG